MAAGPRASVLIFALAPDKLIGWPRAPHPDEVPFLPERVAALPALGRLRGRGNTANVEVVMRAKPDVIVDTGSTSATYVTLAERVFEQTGILYRLFDGTLADTRACCAKWAGRVASDPAVAASVRAMPGWRDVPAVANGRVYVPPDVPFGWFYAPPSLKRLLGAQWLARILHPDLFPEPLATRVKAFHTLYYHREPTDTQIRALLEAAGPLK